MVEVALSNTDRLLRLMNAVLDLDRLESGREVLSLSKVSAADLAAQACDTMQGQAHDAHVEIRVEVLDSTTLMGDGDRLMQVLVNLLSNAVKFSPEHGTVTLRVSSDNTYVRFNVRDQGRGVPPDLKETIFEPFHQVERTDRTEKRGTGLGLAISRTIVEQHRGRIWVESDLGCGSVFHVQIPRSRD